MGRSIEVGTRAIAVVNIEGFEYQGEWLTVDPCAAEVLTTAPATVDSMSAVR
jgi:hypothetical protein